MANRRKVKAEADYEVAGRGSAYESPWPQTRAPRQKTRKVPAENMPKSSTPPTVATDANRQIIRHGDMSFEVDSFDSAFLQITKIAAEEGGFISDSDSEKLANGKMSGDDHSARPAGSSGYPDAEVAGDWAI